MEFLHLGHPFLQGLKIRQDKFRIDHLNVSHRIERTEFVGHILVFKASNGVGNGIHIPDMVQKLIPQSLSFARPLDQSGNVEEFKCGRGHFLGMDPSGKFLQPLVRNRDNAQIWLDGAESVTRHFRPCRSQAVEDC